ncbi:MAG: site-2 protease family protein [Phycisphaerae bacterium]|nr:site-2 protease family protein [Phycisphaerae bacterium]
MTASAPPVQVLPPRSPVYLRPRIGPVVTSVLGLVVGTWLFLTFAGEDLGGLGPIEHPFVTAALIVGVPFALWLCLVHARTGIRIDDAGLRDLGTSQEIHWHEIREIQLLGDYVKRGGKPAALRFVQVRTDDGRAIRFADLGPLGMRRVETQAGLVQDIPQSGLLLALIAERTRTSALFPPQWRGMHEASSGSALPSVVPVDEDQADEHAPPSPTTADGSPPRPETPPRLGEQQREPLEKRYPVVALARRYTGQFVSLFWVGLKTIKIFPALLSFGAFAVVFSWEFAALILLMIGFHECGHVYAMWRCGVKVKGIYFIPFLGGAAVSQGLAKSRWGNAFIQINGPIYGTVLALLFLAAFYVNGQEHALLAAVAGWGALINLFNLLPIMPLDGGRMLGEISHSLNRAAGRYAVFGSLLLGGLVAYFSGLTLLWIMVVIGALEFGRQLTAATQKAMMDRFGADHPLSYDANEHFSALARPIIQPLTDKQRKQARDAFDMLLTEAQLIPMKGWQTAVITVGYIGLAIVLVVVLWTISHIEGAGQAFDVLT